MKLIVVKSVLPLLLVLQTSGADSGGLSHEQKASRRVVRLYTGSRPKPIECVGEGFQADPDDCRVFHRCIKNGNRRYLSFRFQCGPGTIYDPESEICNHPERTKRTGCGENMPIYVPNIDLSSNNDLNKEIPSPISTRDPISNRKTTISSHFTIHNISPDELFSASKYPWTFTQNPVSAVSTSLSWLSSTKGNEITVTKTLPTKRQVTESFSSSITTPWMSSHKARSTTPRIGSHSNTSPAGNICTSDGFMGDSENCRKFYRCIHNQRGGFIRYEFLCSEPTIWDEDKQSCNHVWAVKRRRCGRGNAIGGNKVLPMVSKNELLINDVSITPASNPTQTQLQINYGSKVTQTQTQIGNGSVIQNQTQINYGTNPSYNKIKPSVLQNQTQISHGTAVSQTQTQINYGDKAVQTQLQIDHSKDSSQVQSQISEQTSTSRTTQNYKPQTPASINTNNICAESGFMGDSEDCKKFYRCVDNGRGGFIRYEFSCGEGTVWDSNLEACNHAWAVKECGGKAPSESTSQSTTQIIESSTKPAVSSSAPTLSSTSTQNYYSSTEEENENDNDIPYGNQQSPTPTKSLQEQTTVTKAPQSPNDNVCRSSGFMGDNSDCKKFYRCVDNGNGGYTRYEFSCGEGTVWDQKIDACNHAWAVENCGGSTVSPVMASSMPTTSTQIISQLPPQNDDYDTGYHNPQHDEPLSSSTTVSSTLSTTLSQTSLLPEVNTRNDCSSSGFMGDVTDCKKFYRCVDNGNGGYTRYEFTCGDGTVWDPKIQACNHAWAVEKCGGNSGEDINKVETTTKNGTENTALPSSSSITAAYEPDEDNDVGYGQQSSETPSVTSTSKPLTSTESCAIASTDSICETTGFMGDNKDCKRFYRCVDDGQGGFIRYEFSCGEGTVWDQTIESCNHPWAVKSPCSQSDNVQSTTQMSIVENKPEPEPDQGDNQYTTQKTSTTSSSMSKPGNQCVQEGFHGDENNCKNFYRCVNNGQGGFNKYEFTCGEGTVWNQDIQACDHEIPDKNCKKQTSGSTSMKPNEENDEMVPESTTKASSSTVPNGDSNYTSQKPQSNEKCESEGFYGDASNCKKFYRCVDNGKGGYTKYDFTCGDGTVWDQEILACNHETSDKNCSTNVGSTTTPSTSEPGVTEHSSSGSQELQTTSQPQVTSSSSENDKCEMEGFFSNSNDCKKFYRCVSNEKGGFTKYDFSCGEGTVWVQEIQACDYDNDISNCSNKDKPQTTQEKPSTTTESSSASQQTMQSQEPGKEDDEYPSGSSSKPPAESDKCTSEGFFGDRNDCTRFYRCVDNGQGGYTKYDFTCGEGTAWDSNLQTCNHIKEVESCQNKNEQDKPSNDEQSTQSSGSTSTTKDGSTTESSQPSSTDKCEQEGYFGSTNDCTKFYRCVDNGNGGFTKYDFTCGEGTIWDQDLTTCNHPQDVVNPSCTNNQPTSSSSSGSSSTEGSTSSSSSTTTQSLQSTTEGIEGSTNCSQESTTNKPANQNVKCEKAGYYPDPNDCKKFYRCVDWDGDGTRFSVYHFDCGEGTIWDPQLETCNHEDSVYPPRDCSGTQSHNETQTTTTEKSTTSGDSNTTESATTQSSTEESTTTQQSTSSEQTTQQTSTTEESTTSTQQGTSEQTTQQSSTDKTTTEQTTSSSTTTQKTTTEQTTTAQTTTQEETSQQSTTNQPTTSSEQTTTQETTTSEKSTTQQSTTSEPTTTQQTTTSEETTSAQTTQQSTTNKQTTQQSSSSEHTTQQSSNTDGTTTESTTTEQTTSTTEQPNQASTTEQMTTESTTEKETPTTESSVTTTTETSTTTSETSTTTTSESNEGTTTESESTTSQETSAGKECPEIDDDQYLYVCPTSFRRHPKYCNMFYQCTEDDNSHELKIAMLKCPNNTIYDESKTQCVEEEKADKKCNGQIARKYRVKRLHLDYKEPIEASQNKHSCSAVGYYPFEKDECSGGFLKCQNTKSGKLRGYVHRCPEGYVYWSISKKCEKQENMKGCKQSANVWRDRWEIPVERKNVAK